MTIPLERPVTYGSADIAAARAHRDRLRREGKDAYMRRAGDQVFVGANPAKLAKPRHR